MSSKTWSMSSQDIEQDTPVPPLSKCTAIKDFPGEQVNDLPFRCGEVLTIVEPCSVVYWYLAENSRGQRGIIPITYVKLNKSPKSALPPPLPPLPPLPPTPSLPSPDSSPLPPLPPKPQPSSSSTDSDTNTFMTYPRLAHNKKPKKKVSRAHSNEFTGSRPPLHSTLSNSHSMTLPRMPQNKSMLSSYPSPSPSHSGSVLNFSPLLSKNYSPHLPPHEYTSPVSRFSPSRNNPPPLPPPVKPNSLSSASNPPPPLPSSSPGAPTSSLVPPPLPSPRNRAKPVAPPVVPKSAISLPMPESLHKHGGSSNGKGIQSRELPTPQETASQPVDIDQRPPAPLPTGPKVKKAPMNNNYTLTSINPTLKYCNQKEFLTKSGWFTPNLETVLCKMMYSDHIIALTSITTGIYIFTHKRQRNKRYVGRSRTAYHDLTQMFHRLFEKENDKLGPLEKEIKFNSPDADQWTFRMFSVRSDTLESECNQRIIQHNTLHPSGLNTNVTFSSKESFYSFAENYSNVLREKARKSVNPIRVSWV